MIDFIQCLRHTKGEFHGKPFKLLPWQEKIIRDVFGTVREDDPTMRQYTTAYIEIPKKQGKSELGAALGAAGSVLQTGGLEARDVVLALMVGNILSTPMRAIRHQLPAYAGFYRPALALRLILANQGLRAVSMAVVTLLYWWVAF